MFHHDASIKRASFEIDLCEGRREEHWIKTTTTKTTTMAAPAALPVININVNYEDEKGEPLLFTNSLENRD